MVYKIVYVKPDTKKKLKRYVVDKEFKSEDKAINNLLENEEKNEI